MCNKMLRMKTTNMRNLRLNLPEILEWVAQGHEVTVYNRKTIVARLCPPRADVSAEVTMPDFASRSRKILGDKVVSNRILEERESSRW